MTADQYASVAAGCGGSVAAAIAAAALGGFVDSVGEWASDPHNVLDAAGQIPGIGEFADVANGVLYLSEGDYVNAAISFIGVIPGIGNAATGMRMAARGVTRAGCEAGEKLMKTGGGCFVAGTLVLASTGLVPIEDVCLGDRVVASAEQNSSTEVDPATWRHVELYLPSDAGAVGGFEIDLLRPTLWIEQVGARVGGSIWLALPEMGVEGPAEVLSVKPCPEIQPGPGRVVTGMFRSASATVLQIRVEGLAEPIGATGAHPFWSEDRLAYVPAGELRPGERLRTLNGDTPAVVSSTPLPGVHRVYNLEVEGDHQFHISNLRLLCHNSCPGGNVWPGTPEEMDNLLGIQGTRIPDAAQTPGRNKVTWQPNSNTKITYEQHPYHPDAPDWHKGPHWHLDTPGSPHKRYLPGDPIPGS